ncbi:membrane protein [Streptomyces sulfonofaciens]|uniref:Membrane protein n=1 Tax=Streptomyces sulfonofaciens TaxID=68272 RepID=A0A919FV94_9ACTN|nr:MFS transporter [Streptomyces sulfonofaciens]GHH73252.1 membrane protein [Streptomyces sulfonofaciens]
MRTYGDLFRVPEFRSLFLSVSAQVAAQTVSGLALGTLVYGATGSPLLSALSMFGSSFAQVAGALTLLSAADRLPPRAALTGIAVVFAVGTAALAVPGLPVWGLLCLVPGLGLVASVGGGVRYGLLSEVLPREGFLLGRSALNMSAGVMQVSGYGLGGALAVALSARATLLAAAVLYLAGACAARFGLERRPARATGRPSVGETWRTDRRLWSSAPLRCLYLTLWVPNGLIVGCESLFVAYAPHHAGLLFAAASCGMLVGDTVAGRFVPRRLRHRLGVPLRLLLAAPYLLFVLPLPLSAAVAAVAVASTGFAASLLLQERLMELTPDGVGGQALGLQSSGLLFLQGVGAALAGAVAQRTSPGTGMVVMAAASIAVTLVLAPGLRPERTGRRGRRGGGHTAVDVPRPGDGAAADR